MKQEKHHLSTVRFATEEEQGDDDNSEVPCPTFMYMGGRYDSMALNAVFWGQGPSLSIHPHDPCHRGLRFTFVGAITKLDPLQTPAMHI